MILNTDPLVSIGLPVLNGGAELEARIASLLSQSYQNIELIICDNASTDRTQEISIAATLNDNRVRYIRNKENIGNARNYNKAFQEARGELFMWAAHDDIHSFDFINECVTKLIANPKAVLCQTKVGVYVQDMDHLIYIAELKSFRNNLEITERYKQALYNLPAVALYGVFRTEIARQIPGFRLIPGGDLLWIQELSLRGDFIYSDKLLFHYIARKYWNSFADDLRNLTRESDLSNKSVARVAKTFHDRLSGIKLLDVSRMTKVKLIKVATQFTIRNSLLSIILRRVLPEDSSRWVLKIRSYVYWRFMHNPNFQIVDEDLFKSRVVNPMIGIR